LFVVVSLTGGQLFPAVISPIFLIVEELVWIGVKAASNRSLRSGDPGLAGREMFFRIR